MPEQQGQPPPPANPVTTSILDPFATITNSPSPQVMIRSFQDPNASGTGVKSQYDAPYRGVKATRTPFRLSTTQGDISFEFWINPSECSWRLPLRTTIEQIQGGAVHHEWDATGINNQTPQKFDQAILNFTFQAGNVAPRSWMDVTQVFGEQAQPVIPNGLANFYDFLALLNAPNITSDGRPNYVIIQYSSLMMPSIMLEGFFTQEGVQWTDNADNPNSISSWGASFVVFRSRPELFQNQMLRDVYVNIFKSALNIKSA